DAHLACDWCWPAGVVCVGSQSYIVCQDLNGDGCLEYDSTSIRNCSISCDSVNHRCTTCVDACSLAGSTTCDGYAGVARCADHDGDGCLDWAHDVTCTGGQTCTGGACTNPGLCTNDCPRQNTHGCYNAGRSHRACGQFDTDPCADWTPMTDCAPGTFCDLASTNHLDPCVQCIDGADCRPQQRICSASNCVPPPGNCFFASAGSLSVPVTWPGRITQIGLFIGASGMTFPADNMLVYLTSPTGTNALVVDCTSLHGSGPDWAYWNELTSPSNVGLAGLVGENASGNWTLRWTPCFAGSAGRLETWGVCVQ
ncbi:MAG: proprotein convertase P-domain-containing protein, partial [Deltaproteobacteria bacterium]